MYQYLKVYEMIFFFIHLSLKLLTENLHILQKSSQNSYQEHEKNLQFFRILQEVSREKLARKI